ncbi:recombinase family protein [Amycolatopsis dongchuanensis]
MEARGCVEVFVEEGVTASEMPGPSFRQLVDKVQRGDRVLLPDPTRLTRDPARLDFIVSTLHDLGVHVEYLDS